MIDQSKHGKSNRGGVHGSSNASAMIVAGNHNHYHHGGYGHSKTTNKRITFDNSIRRNSIDINAHPNHRMFKHPG